VSQDAFEKRQLQPNAGYMRLYRESMLEVCAKAGRQSKGAEHCLAKDHRIGTDRRLVAQAVLGWNQILHSLQKIDLLRREGFFRAA
jgi:hypothetical protein